MALIKCTNCGKMVSSMAAKCPSCGYPVNGQQPSNNNQQSFENFEKKQPETHQQNQYSYECNMGPGDAIRSVFNKYADFTGRARRSEYWYFCLFNSLILIVLYLLMLAGMNTYNEPGGLYYLALIAAVGWELIIFIPSLSVFWRRMHDIGQSGAWFLIAFIPIVGAIILFIFTVTDGNKGPNIYGEDPKRQN
jgi:uncharacterized membrane protein YhaH (DUF805 family)/ribosomal protein L37E